MSVVQSICSRMAILDKGRAALIGEVNDIFANKPKELRELMGDETDKVSLLMEADEFDKYRSYLEEKNIKYKLMRG